MPSRRIFLDYGFRIFFLGAAAWTVFDMALWTASYTLRLAIPFPPSFPSPMSWHAHEMIYGYGVAVVAGFLLTAVGNWTGRKPLHGYPLALLFLCWLLARVIPLQGSHAAFAAGRVLDLLFLSGLGIATLRPCIQSKQKRNGLLVGAHLALIAMGSLLYSVGSLLPRHAWTRIGLYLGVYVLMLLSLVMGRRVIPFFVQSASAGRVRLKNFPVVDAAVPLLFVIYAACELSSAPLPVVEVTALLLAVLLGVRLAGWYAHFLWRRPLLWVLYLGYAWFFVGFVLRAVSAWQPVNPYLPLHAFSAGGIGMLTLGMMARVALGHSGRSISQPPRSVAPIFLLLTASVASRVLLPLPIPSAYLHCMAAAQILWLAAFLLFILVYAPILTSRISEA